jgi:hypothetical protein
MASPQRYFRPTYLSKFIFSFFGNWGSEIMKVDTKYFQLKNSYEEVYTIHEQGM